MRTFLKNASYKGEPKFEFEVSGEIAKSALGAINVVRADKQSEPWVLKTVDLGEQNIYAMVKGVGPKKKTIRGSDVSFVVYTDTSRRACKEWAALYRAGAPQGAAAGPHGPHGHLKLVKIAWVTKDLKTPRDGAKSILMCNEFLNEACVGRVASQLQLPHIVKTHDAWIEEGVGHILMDYGGQPMQRAMVDFSLAEMQSAIVQTIVTLAVAQHVLHLKHHDVHLENVFINRVKATDAFKGKALSSKPVWGYKLTNDLTVYIRHAGILAKLGDFGLSSITEPTSATRFERADYAHLNAGEFEWGAWNGTLQHQRSYDMVTLLSKFFLEEEVAMTPESCLPWLQGLYTELRKMDSHITASAIGRPLRDAEGDVSPLEFLKSPAFKAFTTPPTNAADVLMIMG